MYETSEFRRRRKGPLSGGLRVTDELLGSEWKMVVVLCDAVVLCGYHNSILSADLVKPGYKFYVIAGVGDWHDVIPLWYKKDGNYMRLVSAKDPLINNPSGDKLEARNKKLGLLVKTLDKEKGVEPDWESLYHAS